MIDIAGESERLLSRAQFSVMPVIGLDIEALCFENHSVIGFLHVYENVDLLISRWRSDSEAVFRHHAFAIRKAGPKAWNTYTVFLSSGDTDAKSLSALHLIEENLSGTRKIARGGIYAHADVDLALLSLLPIQNAPMLEAIDVENEIKSRTSDVPPRGIEAFLSHRSYDEVINILESAQ